MFVFNDRNGIKFSDMYVLTPSTFVSMQKYPIDIPDKGFFQNYSKLFPIEIHFGGRFGTKIIYFQEYDLCQKWYNLLVKATFNYQV